VELLNLSGLIWGWRTLSPNVPFTEATQNPNGQNTLILMTDGDNGLSLGGENEHSNGVYHLGEGHITTVARRAEANALTLELCEAIKADGIRILTVTFRATQQSTKDLLIVCASAPTDAYNASTNESLVETFRDIEENLLQQEVRLIR